MHLRLLLICVLSALCGGAQSFRLFGRITNASMEPLPFATIEVRDSKVGTTAREDGTYEVELEAGTYSVVVSMMGYKAQTFSLSLSRNFEQHVILEAEDAKALGAVVVRGRYRDRAEEIIRQVILHKEDLKRRTGDWSCNVYIRAVQEDSTAPKRGDTARALDAARMAMTEIFLKLDTDGSRVKEERLGVKRRGPAQDLFYLTALDGNFDLHQNLLQVPALSATPFVSPFSWSGLSAYRFKTLNIDVRKDRKIYTISVRPRQLSNAAMEGVVVVDDSGYLVRSARLRFPPFHLPAYDAFEMEQSYGHAGDSAWMLLRQRFEYVSKGGRRHRNGTTEVAYDSFQLRQSFGRRHFGTEVSATTSGAYKQDSTFWASVRTAPLTSQEVRIIRYRDSLQRVFESKPYQDSVDRATNRVTWKKISFTGQTLYNREKERTWDLPPVASLFQPLQFGGGRINPAVFFSRRDSLRRFFSVHAQLSYGLRNRDLNGSIRMHRTYNPFNRGYVGMSVGRDFQYIFQGDAWINMLKRSNIFLNQAISAGTGLELVNGLFLHSSVEVAFRRPVSGYRTGTLGDSLLGDFLTDNVPVDFDPYNAVYGGVRLQYTPFQRYVREPHEKIILGSSWPTVYVSWRGGIPGPLRSRVDFNYLEFGLEQEVKLGLAGLLRYHMKTGDFTSRRDLRLVDYKFQRRGDPLLLLNPNEAFQALDSTFPVFNRFYQAHFVHQFNGFFLNRIPLLKRLGLREVAGAGALLAPERNLRYGELFAGVERVFKWPFNPLSKFKIGGYVVGSAANRFQNPLLFKIGFTTWDKQYNRWR